MTICMDPSKLLPVSEFKTGLDSYFRKLDGGTDPKYMVVAIVAKDVATIQALRADSIENGKKVITHEQGRRYLELVSQVPGSFAMDIGAKDYSPILKKIGLEIENRSVVEENTAQVRFELKYRVDTSMETIVTVERGSAKKKLSKDQFTITKNVVEIVDQKIISMLKPGDRIRVHFRPASQLPVLK
jgi:hypothetical protein